MRTIPELLQLLISHEEKFTTGLCLLVADLYFKNILSMGEQIRLLKWLHLNLPERKFFGHSWSSEPRFSFPFGEWPPRKEWLENQIESFKKYRIMKRLLLLLCIIFTVSCDKETTQTTHFPYLPDQELMLDIEVIPMSGSIVRIDEMIEELNADYFNRYGIGVRLTLMESKELPDEVLYDNKLFYPRPDSHNVMRCYVLPKKYINLVGAGGYAMLNTNSFVIREERQLTETLAHEIGHLLGLCHSDNIDNIMHKVGKGNRYTYPNSFDQHQVEVMKQNLMGDKILSKQCY